MMQNKSFATKIFGARRLAVVAGVAVVMLATGVGVTAAFAGPNPPPPAPAPKPATLTVGNPATCKGATYPTINAAVTAASSGDTIKVCAGNYPENVMVTKPLTFRGAQAGHDARHRNDPSRESVVNNQSGDFTLTGTANHVTIDGFTIADAGNGNAAGAYNAGVDAFAGSSGLTLVNNIVRDNQEGINFQNPDPSMPALLKHNAFIDNSVSDDGSGNSGTGVFISNGPANHTSINENSFTGHTQTAINFAGNPSNFSVGLTVTNNASVNDATFVVATDSSGAEVSHNTITVQVGMGNGTGILDFGGNQGLLIDSNMITGGNATGTSGIRVGNFGSGPDSVNTHITNNKVSGRYNGVRLSAGSGHAVSGNNVSNSSNDGILSDGGSGYTFNHNTVMTSALHDCEDDTTGTGTAGTANTWMDNMGNSNNSLPAAICPKH